MKKYTKYITVITLGLILTILFWKYPAPHDRILNIQNYLITVGGIISAFVIAYLSAKIFNIKTDRDNRQIQIDKLGERLTAFRQPDYLDKLTTLEAKTTDAKLKTEIGKTKDSINQYYNDSL